MLLIWMAFRSRRLVTGKTQDGVLRLWMEKTGTPILITVHTCLVIFLLVVMRKNIYKLFTPPVVVVAGS